MDLAGSLRAPLDESERARVRAELEALLAWQRELGEWVVPEGGGERLAAGTPIVSLSVRGELCGCQLYSIGAPSRRLARAFLAALSDPRFRPLEDEARAELVAQASYLVRVRRLKAGSKVEQFAAGVHGLALVTSAGPPVFLIPDVARNHELDEAAFVAALEEKSGLGRAGWDQHAVFAFETERVVARTHESALERTDPLTAALAWLARQVEPDGRVRFGLDPNSGAALTSGFLRHARAASVVQALGLDARYADVAERARSWLHADIQRALAGDAVEDWPATPPLVAATLALACLAALDLRRELRALADDPRLAAEPWHAAQVAAALGEAAPASLWAACVAALDEHPFAPWTAIAAQRRGDARAFERALAGLRASIPSAAALGFAAEPAIAGLTVEALALDPQGADEHARALELLRGAQLWGDNVATPNAVTIHGAFPLLPNRALLRSDATAHAALALATARTGTSWHTQPVSAHGTRE